MAGYGIYIHDYAVIREGLYNLVFNDCNTYPISSPIPEWDQFHVIVPPKGEPYGNIEANNCKPNKVEIRGGTTTELREMSGLVTGVGIPFEVKGDIYVPLAHRLDLFPDAELEMLKDTRIYVYGSFSSKGEPGHPTKVYGSEDKQGYWGGIYLDRPAGTGANRIEYLHILNGGGGTFEKANITLRGGSHVVENCKISKSGSCGIRYFSTDATLTESNNVFADNAGGGICEN